MAITANPQVSRPDQKDGTAVRKPCRACGVEVLHVGGLVLEVREVEPHGRCSGCGGAGSHAPAEGLEEVTCRMCGGSGQCGRVAEAGMVALDSYCSVRVLGFWEGPFTGECLHREHACSRREDVAA